MVAGKYALHNIVSPDLLCCGNAASHCFLW